MLERLVEVADLAGSSGLAIVPTLFTGHMSGVNWIPPWALGGSVGDDRFRVVSGGRVTRARLRNWYADTDVARAQALLAGEAAAALAGHEAVWAWDLGNENSNCVVPPSRSLARDWLERITSAIRAADPALRVTAGLHMEDMEEDRRLGPREACEACDFLSMHGYPLYARWADGPTDEHVLSFLAHITRWLGQGRELCSRSSVCRRTATVIRVGSAHDYEAPRLSSRSRPRRRTRNGPWLLCIGPAASARCCGATRTTTQPSGSIR